MARKSTAPRIGEQSAKFYPTVFSSLNAGLEYTADAWPVLYRHTLEYLRKHFTGGELKLMIDVFNSTALTTIIAGQQLDIQVADGMKLDGLDKKWNVNAGELNTKIAGLTIFEAACLEIWANGFWYRAENVDDDLTGKDINEWIAQLL